MNRIGNYGDSVYNIVSDYISTEHPLYETFNELTEAVFTETIIPDYVWTLYVIDNCLVVSCDGGDVVSSMTIDEFIEETIKYVLENREEN